MNVQYQPVSNPDEWKTYVLPDRNTHVFMDRDEAEGIARRLVTSGQAEYARVSLGNSTLAEFGQRYD